MRKYKSVILFLIILVLSDLSGETILSTLDEIAAFGAENSLDYLNSQVSLMKAENDIQNLLLFEDTTISLEGSYSDGENPWALNSRIDIPILEQISITGSLNLDKAGTVSVNLKPLAHSENRQQSLINYESSLISAENSRIEAEYNAVSTILSWMLAQREYKAAQQQAGLYEKKYNDDKVRYELDEISFDDLQDSMVNWSENRISLSEKEKALRTLEFSLYASMGANMEDISIDLLTVDEMKKSIEEIKAEIDHNIGSAMNSCSYMLASLDREKAEVSFDNTWLYNPDLTASATVNFDSEGYTGFSATMLFSISLDDFQKDEKKLSGEELKIAARQEIQSRNEAKVDYYQALQTLESSALNRDIAIIEYEQREILYSEAQLLHERGDISQWELEENSLSLQISENSLFKTLSEEYLAWLFMKNYQ